MQFGNSTSIKKTIRATQPLGFILLLGFFAFPHWNYSIILFWTGVSLSILGTWFELRVYIKTPKKFRTQLPYVFGFGILIKVLLIVAIVLRINDYPYSLFILLGTILVAFIWGIMSFFIKPEKKENSDILDA